MLGVWISTGSFGIITTSFDANAAVDRT